jgi:hypothetical protein
VRVMGSHILITSQKDVNWRLQLEPPLNVHYMTFMPFSSCAGTLVTAANPIIRKENYLSACHFKFKKWRKIVYHK